VLVSNVVKKVNLLRRKKQSDRKRMDRCVSPTFVKEVAGVVEVVKIGLIVLRSEERKVGDFKVVPKVKAVCC
jgi:hypothetical protein